MVVLDRAAVIIAIQECRWLYQSTNAQQVVAGVLDVVKPCGEFAGA